MPRAAVGPVALTPGDPGGVGLELTLRAWETLGDRFPFVLLADRRHVAALANAPPIVELRHPEEALAAASRGLPLVHVDFCGSAEPGHSNPDHYPSMIKALARATRWAVAGRIAGIVTNPAPKAAFLACDPACPGHTEWLATQTGAALPVMLMANAALRVATVTTHVALRDVPQQMDSARIEACVRVSGQALRVDFGIEHPAIGVTGLNPHAGEAGQLGAEDDAIIAPAIARLRAEGLDVKGPLPADSIFGHRLRRQFHAVVCMYHDQALIPVKTLDADDTVNVTLGLPIVRTSPGHGTALDLAGTGRAHPGPLIHSITLATTLSQNRCRQQT